MEGSWNDCDEGYGATFAGLSSWTFDRKQQLIAELEFTRRKAELERAITHARTAADNGTTLFRQRIAWRRGVETAGVGLSLKKREQDAGSIGVKEGGTGAGYHDESFEESEYGSGEWEEEGDGKKEGEAAGDELEEEYDANDFEEDELNDLAGETAALESEAVLEAYLSAQDAQAIHRRNAELRQSVGRVLQDKTKLEATQEEEETRGGGGEEEKEGAARAGARREALLEKNMFYTGSLMEAAAAVRSQAAAAAAEVVERVDRGEEALGARKDWILDPSRSDWGIATQSDCIDSYSSYPATGTATQIRHRGTDPYNMTYVGAYTGLYIKRLNPALEEQELSRLLKQFLALFGALSNFRIRTDREGNARAAKQLHGRRIAATRQQLRIGETAIPRPNAADEDDDTDACVADGRYVNNDRMLAIFECFFAVRDGDIETVASLIGDGLVSANIPIFPRCFPQIGGRRPGLPGAAPRSRRWEEVRGDRWPAVGFEGSEGDTLLHLAARYGDVEMVELLLRLGVSPLKKNALNQKALDCVGIRLLSTLKSHERGDEEEEGLVEWEAARQSDASREEEEERNEEVFSMLEDAMQDKIAAGRGTEVIISDKIQLLPTVSLDKDEAARGFGRIHHTADSIDHKVDSVARGVWQGGAWRKHFANGSKQCMLGDHFGADKRDTQKCTLYVGPTDPPPASAKDVGGLGRNRRVGRIPRGFSWGAPKTGPLTGVDQHMSGMGKGNATRYAGLYDGRGLSIGKPSVLSTASGAAFGMSFGTPVEQGLAGNPSEKRTGSMVKGRRVWGPFSRIQGCGHLLFALDSQGDLEAPGPADYQSLNTQRGLLTVAPHYATVCSAVYGKSERWNYIASTSDLGPGAYDITAGIGMTGGGFSFGFGDRNVPGPGEAPPPNPDEPGPGHYHPYPQGQMFGGGFAFGFGDRNLPALREAPPPNPDDPGPGHYDPYHQRQMFASVGSCLGTFPVATREEAQLVAPVRGPRIVQSGQHQQTARGTDTHEECVLSHIGGHVTGTPPEIEKNDAHRGVVGRQRTFNASKSRLRGAGD